MSLLTCEEWELFKCQCLLGLRVPELAKHVQGDITTSGLNKRLKRAHRKLGANNDLQAVIYYYKEYLPAVWKQHSEAKRRLADEQR